MKSDSESTWWKRLFIVLEIATALLGVAIFALIYFSTPGDVKPPLYGLLIALVPAGIIRLIRIAATYVIEGGRSETRK